MYVGDVGQNDIEEVDVVTAGNNYGWPVKEGSFCFDNNGSGNGFVTDDSPCPSQPPGLVDPLVVYDHDEGVAIVGGFVYRGIRAPTLAGRYLFGDYAHGANQGRLFAIDKSSNGSAGVTFSELRVYGQGGLGMSLLGFGEDASHDVYVLANSTGVPSGATGTVMRIPSRASVQQQRNYRARQTGDQQVPAPIDTPAIGQALIDAINSGNTYFNVHTSLHQPGEIRGLIR